MQPAFVKSADFAINKPAGQPCSHLSAERRCDIHQQLRPRGFAGCDVFDCFGAGQQVTQVMLVGHDWQQDAQTAQEMFSAFDVLRRIHEVRWYLAQAELLAADDGELRGKIAQAAEHARNISAGDAEQLASLDLAEFRSGVGDLLDRVSLVVRSKAGAPGRDMRYAELINRSFRGVDLRRTCLRGALLLGADLSQTDLREADLLGADLRAADLRGADLSTSLFLTQPQIQAARGDEHTRIPSELRRPSHWMSADAG